MKKYLFLLFIAIVVSGFILEREYRFQYVNTEQAPVLEAKDKATKVLFVGDIMLGRNVETLSAKNGEQFPFINIRDYLLSVDAVIANLEGPVMDPHFKTPNQTVRFSFASTTPALLARNNIKVVSLANNHTADYGQSAFLQTEKFLNDAGIIPVGHPYAFSEDYVHRAQFGNTSFLFLAFNLTNPNFDTVKALSFVKGLEKHKDEYVVAMVHGGEEYVLTSNNVQKKFYRGLIDAGIDAVIAHHPHVIQEVELYNSKPIFYSLGNFIFDQYFSKDVEEGLTLRLTFTDSEVKYEIIPVQGNHSQTKIIEGKEREILLTALAGRSSKNIQESVKNGELIIAR